mgnify:CR=1 FL=1
MTHKHRLWIARSVTAAALAACGAIAQAGTPMAQAAGAGPDTTDRIIVKYRDGSTAQVQANSAGNRPAQRQRSLDASAARFNARLTHVRGTGLGADVLRLDRRMANADVAALAREIATTPEAAVYGRLGVHTQRHGTTAAWLIDALNLVYGERERRRFLRLNATSLVLTLGTGMGSGLYLDGRLVPNLELAHHVFRHRKTYEQTVRASS